MLKTKWVNITENYQSSKPFHNSSYLYVIYESYNEFYPLSIDVHMDIKTNRCHVTQYKHCIYHRIALLTYHTQAYFEIMIFMTNTITHYVDTSIIALQFYQWLSF